MTGHRASFLCPECREEIVYPSGEAVETCPFCGADFRDEEEVEDGGMCEYRKGVSDATIRNQ